MITYVIVENSVWWLIRKWRHNSLYLPTGEYKAFSTRMRFRRKLHVLYVLAFRPHVNDEKMESFSPKTETFEKWSEDF